MVRLLLVAAMALGALVLPASSRAATLTPTPYMGWNPYYASLGGTNEATFKAVANSLISTGLQSAGYKIFWLDYGWASGARDSSGQLTINSTQWPDGMAGFTSWLHSNGFLAGIYTDAGMSGCSNEGVGSYGHYASGSTNPYSQDVNQFAAWGFDAVKVDFCGAGQEIAGGQLPSSTTPQQLYTEFSQAIASNSSGRPMILNVCNFWDPGAINGTLPTVANSSWDNFEWAPSIAQSWRTDTDIGYPGDIQFQWVVRNLNQDSKPQPSIQEAAGPGHWNDPDYLGPGLGMTDTQAQSQFSMWAMVAAPLILGSDPRNLTSAELSMLENPNVIAIDQDPLGAQATMVQQSGSAQVWAKPLAGGDRAVALFNPTSSPQQVSTTASAVGLSPASGYHAKDLWANVTTTTDPAGDMSATVPADGTVLYRVSPAAPERLSVSLAGDGSGTVNDDSGAIACPGTCSSVYGQGRLVTLTATPAPGSLFTGWSGGGCSGTGTCQVSLPSDTAVTATFARSPTLTVKVIGAGAGTVTGSGISCPGRCSASYPAGTPVTLAATPAPGSQFGAWLGGGCPAANSRCTVTIAGDATVTVAFDRSRSGTAYVVGDGNNTVTPVDLASNTVERSIGGFAAPRSIAVAPDGGTAFVVNTGNATVTPINLATNTIERSISGFSEPGPIAVAPDGRTAYVLENQRRLVAVNLATDQAEPAITFAKRTGVGAYAGALAIAPGGKTAYLGTFNAGAVSGTVAVVNLATGAVNGVIRGFSRPAAIAIAPGGTTAYVADAARGDVTPIDLATKRPISAPALTAPGAFPGADAVAVSPDGGSAYVAGNASHAIGVIDTGTNTEKPIGLTGTAGAGGIATTPTGGTVYALSGGDGSMIPIDVATGTERPALTGFSSPGAIVVTNRPPLGDTAALSAKPKLRRGMVRDAVTCWSSTASCTMTQTLTVTERSRAHRVVFVVVGARTVTIEPGQTVQVAIRLNAIGKHLLRRFGGLQTVLALAIRRGASQDTVSARPLTI